MSVSVTTIDDFPNELLFIVIQHLPLITLICIRSVSARWKGLVREARLPLGRRALLDLYLDAVNSPGFLKTRSDLLQFVEPFDREEYLEKIESPYKERLPIEFRTWALEWPLRAVIGRIWPCRGCNGTRLHHSDETASKRKGKNYLHKTDYTLTFRTIASTKDNATHTISVYEDNVDTTADDCPDRACGLIIHNYKNDGEDGPVADVLVFGAHGTGAEFSGQVVTVDVDLGMRGGPNWVEFLRAELRRSEKFLERKKERKGHKSEAPTENSSPMLSTPEAG